MPAIRQIIILCFLIGLTQSGFAQQTIVIPGTAHPAEQPPRFGLLEHFSDFGKVVDRTHHPRTVRLAARAQQRLEMSFLHDRDFFPDHTLIEMIWNDVEPEQGRLNLFSFPREAEEISNHLSCGLRVALEGIPDWVGDLFYDPEKYPDYETFLAMEDETGLTGEEKLQLWEEYAAVVAATLGRRATSYNILREPHNTLFPIVGGTFWCPEETDWADWYAPVFHDLYVRAARAIRANDPDATISGSGFLDSQIGPDTIFCPTARQSYRLVEHLTTPGRFDPPLNEVLDALSVHIYPEHPSNVNNLSFGYKVDLSSSHLPLFPLMDRLGKRLSLELNEYGYRFEDCPDSTQKEEFASVLIRMLAFSLAEGTKNSLFFEAYDYGFDPRDMPPNVDETTRYLLRSLSDFRADPPVLLDPEWTEQATTYQTITRLFSGAMPDNAFNESAPAPGSDLVWRRFTTGSGDLVAVWSNEISQMLPLTLQFDVPTNEIRVSHFFIDGTTSEEVLEGDSRFTLMVRPFESLVVRAVRTTASSGAGLLVDEASMADILEEGRVRVYVGAPVRFWWPVPGRLDGRLVVKKSETNPGAGMIRVDGRFEPLAPGRCTVYLLDGLADEPVASLELDVVNLSKNLLPGPEISFVRSGPGSHEYRSLPLFWQTRFEAPLVSPATRFDQGGTVWIDREKPSTYHFGDDALSPEEATFLGRGAFGLYGKRGVPSYPVYHVSIRNSAHCQKIRLEEDYYFVGWCRIDGGGEGLGGRLPIIPIVSVDQMDEIGDRFDFSDGVTRLVGNDAVALSRGIEPGEWFEITSHHGLFPEGKVRFNPAEGDPERTPEGAILSFNVFFQPDSFGSVLYDELYFGPFPESGLLILQPDGIGDSVVETDRLEILPHVDLKNHPTASRLHAFLVASPLAGQQDRITPEEGVDFLRQPVIVWEGIASFLTEHVPDFSGTHGVIRLELRDLHGDPIAVEHSGPFELPVRDEPRPPGRPLWTLY